MGFLKKINPGILFLGLNGFLATFAFSFVPIFLVGKGFSFSQIIFLYAIYTGLSSLLLLFIPRFHVKKSIFFGIFAYSLMAFVFVYYTTASYLLYALFSALSIIFFWIPLNYFIFKEGKGNSNASDSSFYVVLPGVISIIIPPISSLVITNFGYQALFLITAMIYLLAMLIFWNLVREEVIDVKTSESIRSFKGFKSISLIEGSLHFFVGTIIPVYSLMFFKTARSFSYFLSYLGLIAFIIALFIAKRSDKTRRRKRYLYILLAAMAASIFLLPFAKTSFAWIITIIPLTLFYTVSYPIRLAILLDKKKPDLGFWKAREIFLNFGRLITLSISALLFYYQMFWAVLLMYGILLIPYIFLVEYKLKHVR